MVDVCKVTDIRFGGDLQKNLNMLLLSFEIRDNISVAVLRFMFIVAVW